MSSDRPRCFVAIELPEELLSDLVRLRERVDCGEAKVRWSAPGTMHLTLSSDWPKSGPMEAGSPRWPRRMPGLPGSKPPS